MGPMGNGGTGGMGYSSMSNRVQGYGAYWLWGTRDMGHMGNGIQRVWGIWAMRPTGGYGYRGMGHWGYGVQGVWAMGYRGMGHMGNGAHGRFAPKISKRCQVVKKMSSCQKDVKCQKMKHLDYGGGSQKN